MYTEHIGSFYRYKCEQQHCYCDPKLNINSVLLIIGLVSQVTEKWLGWCYIWSKYWPPLKGKDTVIQSLPHLENVCPQNVTTCSSGKSGEFRVICSLLVITKVLAVFTGNRECDTLPTTSWNWASTDHQRFVALHHGSSKHNVAIIVYIRSFEQFSRLKCSWTLSCSFEYE